MPVLPHQDGTTVSPRGLSALAENATSTFLMRSILHYITSCPQIYKSTKCNDMQQCGSCPRGPFCAFAHVESKFPLYIRLHTSQNSFITQLQKASFLGFPSFCLQNPSFQTNPLSPHRAPHLPLGFRIHFQSRRRRAPADTAWCPGLPAPRLQIPSRSAQGRM